ncbi:MAG: FitA-like ribbon-helix-helix domain-containing protein [Polyangiales bacterium]
MQYTIRGISPAIDQALRAQARAEGKSLNQVTLALLRRALGLEQERVQQRDLRDIAGSWAEDPDIDEALQAQRIIDDELWR